MNILTPKGTLSGKKSKNNSIIFINNFDIL